MTNSSQVAQQPQDSGVSIAATEQSLPKGPNDEEQERQKLVREERRAVIGLRLALLTVLVVATVVVSVSTYKYTKNDQKKDFESQFDGYAQRVIEAFHAAFERKLGAFDALANSITSEANGNFPNVSLPDLAVRGSDSRVLADIVNFAFAPLVTKENRPGWEAFVSEKYQLFVEENFFVENDHLNAQDAQFDLNQDGTKWPTRNENVSLPPYIPMLFNPLGVIPPDAPGPFLPFWLISPSLSKANIVNLDIREIPEFADGLPVVFAKAKAVVFPARKVINEYQVVELPPFDQMVNNFFERSQFRHEFETYRSTPISALCYPVFDGFGSDRNVVGLVMTHMYWKEFFYGILPDNAGGVMAVLKNSDNQTFTFFVDGSTVQYLGEGDFHDTKFDYLEQGADVALYIQQRAKPSTRAYTTVGLDPDFCSYTLSVYPSNELEDEYVDERPIWYTIGAVCIFAFTSVVFVAYDWLMERRQRAVVDQAVNYFGVVSSLFPRTVRERMLENAADTKLESSDCGDSSSPGGSTTASKKQSRIADLFQNCTVFFADIAGFTRWSSGRDPDEVFELLETMYGVFDALAEKLGVFKIETIGDCYLAVTGLPEPQEDHAVIMVQFATECLSRINELLEALSLSLGEETEGLGIRIGLHSGPVIAGVLRGQRRRFQLFGDTVNTASRMESTGMKGKIHASEQTAKELISRGMESWVQARDDKIVAKGKGEMQTYWIDTRDSSDNEDDSAGVGASSGDCELDDVVKKSVEALTRGGAFDSITYDDDPTKSVKLHRL